ncbi:MAG: hypothetical protein IJS63_09750 [Bacteroidaceae bacterium]|nr:hypothetical protein [Bacteroidaceae bacterium]
MGLHVELKASERNYRFYRTGVFSGIDYICHNTYLQLPVMARFSFGAIPTTEPELTTRAKVTKQVRNLAYINAEITNSKGELCNEGEAIYFLMNQERAKEMGFLHCEVEEE